MPSYEEVEGMGNKPFVAPDSSKLQAAPADMAKALGLDLEEKNQEKEKPSVDLAAQQKANEEAEKVIRSREARIQDTTEELYRVEERTALKDDTYLAKLIDSKDPLDRKLAEKILKRNAETFGASSIEDFKLLQAKSSSDNPLEQKVAVQDLEIASLKQKQKDSEWSEWKKANSVDDIAESADDIHASYPEMPYGDVLAMARGKMGLTNANTKKAASAAVGGAGAPETDEGVYASPLAKRLLKNPESTMKFAKGYLRDLNS